MNRLVKWLGLCWVMMLSPAPVSAQEAQSLKEQDLEFLEFLGEWETGEGQWVNPLDFLDKPPGNVEEATGEKDRRMEPETDAFPEQRGEHERGPIIPFR